MAFRATISQRPAVASMLAMNITRAKCETPIAHDKPPDNRHLWLPSSFAATSGGLTAELPQYFLSYR